LYVKTWLEEAGDPGVLRDLLDPLDFLAFDLGKQILQRFGVGDHRVVCDGNPLAGVLLKRMAEALFGLYRLIKFVDGHRILSLLPPVSVMMMPTRAGLGGLSGWSTAAFDGSR
jgi:hypothetical protein